MTPIAERAIRRKIAGFGRKNIKNFRHHDGPVRARRCFARGDYFGDRLRVGAVFLVLILEPARILSAVTLAAVVRRRRSLGILPVTL